MPVFQLIYRFFLTQEKRSLFPRFYFIGDDDLLEILGQSTNPVVIQSHLKKLFAGIHNVEFDDGCKNIIAMKSLKGEVVALKRPVAVTTEVEVHSTLNHTEDKQMYNSQDVLNGQISRQS